MWTRWSPAIWKRSECRALGFIDALEGAFRQIADHPDSGSPGYGQELNLPGLRSWPVKAHPHVVSYMTAGGLVECVACSARAARHPGGVTGEVTGRRKTLTLRDGYAKPPEIGSGASMAQCFDSYRSTRVTRASSLSDSGVPGATPIRRSISPSASL